MRQLTSLFAVVAALGETVTSMSAGECDVILESNMALRAILVSLIWNGYKWLTSLLMGG